MAAELRYVITILPNERYVHKFFSLGFMYTYSEITNYNNPCYVMNES